MRAPSVVKVLLLALAYIAAARLGLAMDAVSGFATLVWPPTGIAIAALLLYGYRVAPGIWIGAFVANAWAGAPIAAAVGIAIGNTLEALLAMWALRRLCGSGWSLERLRDVVCFVTVAAVMATALSASIGVSSLIAGAVVAWSHAGETWRAWWVGDAIGALVVAPLILGWARRPRVAPPSTSILEALALGATTILVCMLVFRDNAPFDPAFREPYVAFAPLLWGAVRFGPRGAATTTFVVSVIAIVETSLGHGPFVQETLSRSLLFLQVFIAFIAIIFLVIGAFTSELTDRERDLSTAVESARIAREQAERASALKTDLLNAVSHELRTPLAALRLQIERLEIDIDKTQEDRRRLAERMLAQTTRLAELIETFLTAARVESGRLKTNVREFDIAELVREWTSELRALAEAKRLAISVEAPNELMLSSDPDLVHLIAVNLLGNAIKFTDRGSVRVSVTPSDAGCTLAVIDTGPGIARADHERIFEPFERLEPTRQKHRAGVGLGLSLVQTLTTALGGSIAIESELGAGTTFRVVLPHRSQSSTATSSTS